MRLVFAAGPAPAAIAALAAAVIFAAGGARAQVIEIQPGGAVSIYSGPVRSIDDSRQAIAHAPTVGVVRLATRSPASTLARALQDSAERNQLSARLMEAVAWRESGFNQAALSPKGARGVMQLMPETARRLGVDAADLRGNVQGGGAYMAGLLRVFDGDIILTLAAYNAGPEAVRRWGGVPPYPETRAFVAAVLDRLSRMEPEKTLLPVSR
jgi:soluble lytic murein transglycosylase-like protein